ncbi:hypothetical protein ACUZ8Y_06825 [Aeromonas veronii]|uniref:hypothetical protein n=1 Tax=Aeromonas veronii TaxID=654 RepID=UPI00406BD664
MATNEIAQTGLSSLPPVIYYSEQLFRNNDGEGTEIDLDLCPSTYIVTESYIGRELDFISVDGQVDWTGVNDARVTEAGYIRLYNQELNVCLDYKIKTRVGWKAQLEKLASKERLKAGWEKSIFCLIEKFESWPFEHIPEPDEHIDWVDGKHIVCGWLHFSLLGYPSQTRGRSKDGFASVLRLPDAGIQIISATLMDEWREVANC